MKHASQAPAQNPPAAKKAGGGLKKLAPPPGFKGKPKAEANLLGGIGSEGGNNQTMAAGGTIDLLGDNSQAAAPGAPPIDSIDALLAGGGQAASNPQRYDALAELDFSSPDPIAPAIASAPADTGFDAMFGGGVP